MTHFIINDSPTQSLGELDGTRMGESDINDEFKTRLDSNTFSVDVGALNTTKMLAHFSWNPTTASSRRRSNGCSLHPTISTATTSVAGRNGKILSMSSRPNTASMTTVLVPVSSFS